MEGADDAIGNGESQHSTNVASNLASMTGNGSDVIQTDTQAVDEFDTDSKWEITTLEKASYDCSDMYAEASPDQQNLAQAPESASDTNQSADCTNKIDDSQDVAETTIIENPANFETAVEQPSQTTTEMRHGLEVMAEVASAQEIEAPKTIDAPVEESKFNLPPQNATTTGHINQQQITEVTKNDGEQDQVTKNLEDALNNDNLQSADRADLPSPQHTQDDGTFSLSQTAVDPQMEKMIDNMVEHGGCQQFAETLQQQADEISREKEVENIQREISQASSSLMKGDEPDSSAAAVIATTTATESDLQIPEEKEDLNEQDQTSVDIADSTAAEASIEDLTEAEAKAFLDQSSHIYEPKEEVDDEEKREKEEERKMAAATSDENIIDTQVVKPVTQAPQKDLKEKNDSKITTDTSVEPTRTTKRKKVIEELEAKEDECGSDKPADDKKSLPERPVRSARLKASKRAASPDPAPKEVTEKRRKSKEPDEKVEQERPTKQRLIIKVPLPSRSPSSRKTIATSAPSVIPESKKTADTSFNDFECKKYRCEKCKYSTDRLNNIVHHKKSSCSFFQQHYADHVAAQVESWKRSIQSPKSNSKRSAR